MNILERINFYSLNQGDKTAVCSGLNPENALNYSKLENLSAKFAFYLQEKLKDDKTPIVVYGHKSPYMIVCFLACVKSGRAYCPIDISIPDERVKDIISETNTPLILAVENLNFECENAISLDEIKNIIDKTEQKIDKSCCVKNDDVFYIIFTSGSTGKPKGVQITLDCLNNFLKWSVTLGNEDLENKHATFINQAPFSFDLSVMDLYMSLCTGGTLWCLKKSVQSDYELLLKSLKDSKADVLVSTPSFANMCRTSDDFTSKLMPSLKLFLFCGETLSNHNAEKLLMRFPGAKVINTYGPTESTVAMTEINITEEILEKYNPLPVGMPKPGTHVFIIDKNGSILPENKKGEILIVGDTVSPGYFKKPDINAKVFGEKEINGVKYRSYRTGDEGYIKDSQLFYCGRIDLQIKLHGYRIELEDIENNFLKLSSVKNAVVAPIIKNGSIESLAAFIVPRFKIDNSMQTQSFLRKQLLRFLPSYMIPKKFVFVDSIPMTTNGKIDRKKLLEEI